jgi:hypothetical protein
VATPPPHRRHARASAPTHRLSRRLRCRFAFAAAAGAASAKPAAAEEPVFTQPGYRRPLHWVFKVGDLKASLDFYERVFGMKARWACGLAARSAQRTRTCVNALPAAAGAPPRGVRLRLRGDLQRAVRRRVEQDDGAQAANRDALTLHCATDCAARSPRAQIGYGTEETHFALELTYNYGVTGYENGNDLRCVCLACPPRLALSRPLRMR